MRVWIIAIHPPSFRQDDHLFARTSFASPLALPLRGSFEGYGVEQLVEGDAERILFSHLRELHHRGALHLDAGPFPSDLDGLVGAIGEGRVAATVTPSGRVDAPSPCDLRLSIMYVDERIYVATLAAIRTSTDWEADRRLGGDNGPKDVTEAAEWVVRENPNLAFYGDAASQSAETRELLAEQHDFDVALELLRRYYAPPAGVGSQSEAYGLHAQVAAAVLDVARETATSS